MLYFATKLNSRDIQKFDCLWVPFVVCVSFFPVLVGLQHKPLSGLILWGRYQN